MDITVKTSPFNVFIKLDTGILKNDADASSHLIGLFNNVEPVDQGSACRRGIDGTEHRYGRGLSRAVRAQQTEYFTVLDG